MAKDPAFLFYHHDFIMGTAFLSLEERGAYITILCYMADKGQLTYHQIKKVCGAFDPLQLLSDKFTTDGNDLYYHKRLKFEVEKRKNFCKTRNNNKLGRNQHSDKLRSHDLNNDLNLNGHMGNRNEDVNEDVNVVKMGRIVKEGKFKRPTIEEVRAYCLEIKTTIDPDLFFNNYESQGWIKANGRPVLNWKSTIRTWHARDNKPVATLTDTQKRNINNFNDWEKRQELKNGSKDI